MDKRLRTGNDHPLFRDGKTMRHGYIVLSSAIWGDNQGRYEHRVIMENILGRSLTSTEIVHHINGNTIDNRAENLEIVTRIEHNRKHGKGHILKCTLCGKERWYSKCLTNRLRNGGEDYRCRQCMNKIPYEKICGRCGNKFLGGTTAIYCSRCVRKHK